MHFKHQSTRTELSKLVGLFELTRARTGHSIFMTYLCSSRSCAWLQRAWCSLLPREEISAPQCLQQALHTLETKSALRFVWKADCASRTVSTVSQRRESSLLGGSSWCKSIQNCSHILDLGFADGCAGAEGTPSASWLSTLVWLRSSVAKGVEMGEKKNKTQEPSALQQARAVALSHLKEASS